MGEGVGGGCFVVIIEIRVLGTSLDIVYVGMWRLNCTFPFILVGIFIPWILNFLYMMVFY